MRIFAAECYELAEKAAKGKKPKIALQYTKLAAKLLNLSLRPKKLSDLEQIKKAIAKLKVQEKQRNVGK
jgi:NTP pyrophosphatase (non-canonical NTP hydrolase)